VKHAFLICIEFTAGIISSVVLCMRVMKEENVFLKPSNIWIGMHEVMIFETRIECIPVAG
jgi:hypothetical protein